MSCNDSPSREDGNAGGAATVACRCGAGPHHDLDDRCERGHVLRGNDLALVVGHRSGAFWREHDGLRREIREAVITDAGHSNGDAPRGLELAADGLAQAVLVRDAAYSRLVEAGGPVTRAGRTRRVFTVWQQAADRVEKHLRLVGLKRVPRPTPTTAEYLRDREATS